MTYKANGSMQCHTKSMKPKKKKRKRKLGRPKGHSLKPFDQTRIGFLLKHEVPVEYKLLMEVTELLKLRAPSSELIEAIGYASNDPFFRKAKYWRCLIDYKKYGLRPPVSIQTNVSKELYYIRLRLSKM